MLGSCNVCSICYTFVAFSRVSLMKREQFDLNSHLCALSSQFCTSCSGDSCVSVCVLACKKKKKKEKIIPVPFNTLYLNKNKKFSFAKIQLLGNFFFFKGLRHTRVWSVRSLTLCETESVEKLSLFIKTHPPPCFLAFSGAAGNGYFLWSLVISLTAAEESRKSDTEQGKAAKSPRTLINHSWGCRPETRHPICFWCQK